MPVISLGMDLMQIDRLETAIAKRGARFLDRVFTPEELGTALSDLLAWAELGIVPTP